MIEARGAEPSLPPPPLMEASSPVALFSLPPVTEEAKVPPARLR